MLLMHCTREEVKACGGSVGGRASMPLYRNTLTQWPSIHSSPLAAVVHGGVVVCKAALVRRVGTDETL